MNNNKSIPGARYFYKGKQKAGVSPGFIVKSTRYEEGGIKIILERKSWTLELMALVVIFWSLLLFYLIRTNSFVIRYDNYIPYDESEGKLYVNVVSESTLDIPFEMVVYDDNEIYRCGLSVDNPIKDIPLTIEDKPIKVKVFIKNIPIIPIMQYKPTIRKIG